MASGLREGATVDVTSRPDHAAWGSAGGPRQDVSGPIEALGVAGDLDWRRSPARSSSPTPAERVRAHADLGFGHVRPGQPAAHDIQLDTISGAITVRVPEDSDLAVHLGATSGRVTSAFPQVAPVSGPSARSRTATGLGGGRG